MRTSYPGSRRSLGAGLASVGTVLLLVAGLLVALEAPLASAEAHVEVALCHATGSASNPYIRVIVDDDGSLDFEGHADHARDIIPGVGGMTEEDVDAACGLDYDVAAWGDCDGWYLQASAPKGAKTLKIDGVDVGTPGDVEFVADVTPDGPLSRTFTVQWWSNQAGGTLLHETTVTGTRADCTPPTLTLVKTWDGDPWDGFGFSVTPVGGATTGPYASGDVITLDPGSYVVSESGMPASGYEASAWGGDCAADGTITLGFGDTATCTITNTEIPLGSFGITKTLSGDVTTGFHFTGDFGAFTLTPPPNGSSTTFFDDLLPGTYVVAETIPYGYTLDDITCTANASAVVTGAGEVEVQVVGGEYGSCTFTNSMLPNPTLTLVKIWDGEGVPWPGFGMQVTPLGGGDPVAMTSATPTALEPGTWVASELGDPGDGYVAGDWGGDCAADGTVVLEFGDAKVCTIVNTDLFEPTLTVIKTWVDDVDPYAGFGLYATPTSGPDIPLTSGDVTSMEPGTYTVWETAAPSEAWAASVWGGDCAADGTVTLAYEEHKVCTISNELRDPPELTLVKTWEGEPWDAFGLQVTADPDFVEAMESGVAEVFDPGTYTAMELGMPAEGYEAGEWGGDCAADGTVTLDWDDVMTCTITNYEIPTLIITKTVIGGDAAPDDFELRVTPRDGDPIPMLSGVELEMEPGDYQAAETLLDKYVADPWGGDCDEEGRVTIEWGDHLECTITNTDPYPKLTLIKIVVGGDAEPDDFDLAVTAVVGGAITSVLSGERTDFEAGDYVASEANLVGYAAGEWGGDCAADGSVTLRPVTAEVQDDLVCTITNVATTTTTTISSTTVTDGTVPTTEGGTTTTTTTPGDLELPRTGGGGYLPMLLGGLGLALLGAGLVLLAPRRQPRWVV